MDGHGKGSPDFKGVRTKGMDTEGLEKLQASLQVPGTRPLRPAHKAVEKVCRVDAAAGGLGDHL